MGRRNINRGADKGDSIYEFEGNAVSPGGIHLGIPQPNYSVSDVVIAKQKKTPIKSNLEEMVARRIRARSGGLSLTEDTGDENPRQVAEPYYTPVDWVELPDQNTDLKRGLTAIARNAAGLGIVVEYATDPAKMNPADKVTADAQKTYLEEFLHRPGETPGFLTIYKMILSREYCGNGVLVFSQSGLKTIDGMYYAPGHMFRVRRDGLGYIQEDSEGNERWFKNFGDTRSMDYETGMFATADEPVSLEREANMVWHFPIFSPVDPIYGVVRYVGAKYSVTGNVLQSKLNVNFFANAAMVRFIVLVQDGRLDGGAQKMLEKFINVGAKGYEKAHRALILQPSKKSLMRSFVGTDSGKKSKIEIVKMAMSNIEDATFQTYRKNNDEEVRRSIALAKVYYGESEDVGRAGVTVMKQLALSQVFNPIAIEFEALFNAILLPEILGLRTVETATEMLAAIMQHKGVADDIYPPVKVCKSVREIRLKLDVLAQKTLFEKVHRCVTGRVIGHVRKHPSNKAGEQYVYYEQPLVKLSLIRAVTQDKIELAEALSKLNNTGGITPNDVRTRILEVSGDDLAPKSWGDQPLALTVMEVNSGTTFEEISTQPEAVAARMKEVCAFVIDDPLGFSTAVGVLRGMVIQANKAAAGS